MKDGTINLSYLPIGEIVIDSITKPLKLEPFIKFRCMLIIMTLSEAL